MTLTSRLSSAVQAGNDIRRLTLERIKQKIVRSEVKQYYAPQTECSVVEAGSPIFGYVPTIIFSQIASRKGAHGGTYRR
mgnify:CR=1 FL=1